MTGTWEQPKGRVTSHEEAPRPLSIEAAALLNPTDAFKDPLRKHFDKNTVNIKLPNNFTTYDIA